MAPRLAAASLPTPEALRSLTARQRGIHVLFRAVRHTYRAQRRRPQKEATLVHWIERLLRLFPDEPVGRLALLHSQTLFQRLEKDEELTAETRAEADEALRFLRTDVLAYSGTVC